MYMKLITQSNIVVQWLPETLEYCLELRRKTRPMIDVNIIVNCVLEHEINLPHGNNGVQTEGQTCFWI